MDDKEKSFLDKFVDTFQEVVGSVAKGAITPAEETDESHVAEMANEQMLLSGDAAIAPEAVPAPVVKRRPSKRAKKHPAKAAPAKKKTASEASKRSPPKKTKSSAGRKAVGKKKTAKKVTKKKAKSKRTKTAAPQR